MSHVSGDLVRRYARGDQDIPADQVWAVEAHLETCASCRALLASQAQHLSPLLDTVWAGLEPAKTPARHRRTWTWAAPAGWPWLGMTVLVAAVAMLLDLISPFGTSVVLLLAPIAPILGVAMAWNKAMDPAHEVIAGTPRAGLELVLRRTAAVLLVVIPVLVLVGLPGNVSPGLWLLPCLAFTFATLAIGSLVGVGKAAIGLGSAWVVFVAGPGLFSSKLPLVLQPISLPFWAIVVVGCVAVLAMRADAYARMR